MGGTVGEYWMTDTAGTADPTVTGGTNLCSLSSLHDQYNQSSWGLCFEMFL